MKCLLKLGRSQGQKSVEPDCYC